MAPRTRRAAPTGTQGIRPRRLRDPGQVHMWPKGLRPRALTISSSPSGAGGAPWGEGVQGWGQSRSGWGAPSRGRHRANAPCSGLSPEHVLFGHLLMEKHPLPSQVTRHVELWGREKGNRSSVRNEPPPRGDPPSRRSGGLGVPARKARGRERHGGSPGAPEGERPCRHRDFDPVRLILNLWPPQL